MDSYPSIAKVVVGLPVEGPFDYAIGPEYQGKIVPGQRVRILFNRRRMVGYVVDLKQKSRFKKLNPILTVLDHPAPSLSAVFLELAKEFSQQFGGSWGEAIETTLPGSLRKGTALDIPQVDLGSRLPETEDNVLLHDETRSQRWPVIIDKIQKTIAAQRSVIFLVPENDLLGFVRAKIEAQVKAPIVVFDGKLTLKQKTEQWLRVKREEYCLVVGTRSGIFAPINRPGLIVLYDEEREAYKQEQSPHYSAVDVALMRCRLEKVPLLFVSSAPSVETWERARKEKWQTIDFPNAKPSEVKVVDMGNYNPGKTSRISYPLQNEIQKVLANKGKVILFLNKKGFTTFTQCGQCGFVLLCPRCNSPLTYVSLGQTMVCRRCNDKSPRPDRCPSCHKAYLKSVGAGIERLESEAARFYPEAVIRHYEKESDTLPVQADILVATQALFKHRETFRADLAAIIDFDGEMSRCDFRSAQKVFSLMVTLGQMSKERLLVQTRLPDNACLKSFREGNFSRFYREELKVRKDLELPPFRVIGCIGLRGKKEEKVIAASQQLFELLEKEKNSDVDILDPEPDMVPKLRDQYRYVIMLKSKSSRKILEVAQAGLKKMKRSQGIITTIGMNP